MDDLDGALAGHWLNGEPVFNLADWLPYLHKRRRMSLASVADSLRGALDADGAAALLQLPPGRDPRPVPADWTPVVRPAAPVGPRVQRSSGRVQARALPQRFPLSAEPPAVRHGLLQAFDSLAGRWRADLATGKALTRLVPGLGCGIGMTESAARRLLPALFSDDASQPAVSLQSAELGATPRRQYVEPEGGRWPHEDGAAWTEAERVALFLMRHRDKVPGTELAALVGVSRARIDELIGPARPAGGLHQVRSKDGWAPSPALLVTCGQPLQPLQAAVMALGSW